MARYVVLLRGINLGKARRVAMADLRTVLTRSGYENVATVLQSGNVVLDADQPAAELGRTIEQLIEQRFGFAVDAFLRSHDQMTRIVAKNPLGDVVTDGSKYVVAFMAAPPRAPVDAVLDGAEIGDDRYIVDGTEMYLWCPRDLRDSPLMTILGKVKNGPSTTVRNWNTVQKLLTVMG